MISSVETQNGDAVAAADRPATGRPRTLWGLGPRELHDRFWAARGVQVVRRGVTADLDGDAELYLLTDRDCLTIFRLQQMVETFSWLRPHMLFVRLHNTRDHGYRERVITDTEDRFVRFERDYGANDWRLGRVALTASRELAEGWQAADRTGRAWRTLRKSIAAHQRTTMSAEGHVFDAADDHEVMDFVRELVTVWPRPDATIRLARRIQDRAWGDAAAASDAASLGTRFVGPVWVGAGRRLDGVPSVVGPAVLWDAPEARPDVDRIEWNNIVPSDVLVGPVRARAMTTFQRGSKRIFDIAFGVGALLATSWLFPLIMLAIWLEDGRPFFFGHTRESIGGREFKCWKFRTMFNNAEEIKQKLLAENANQADGPQFFIENDPRITRVGNLLRKANLDEFPQFWNVIRGEMSVVGPRPSPYKENQYCPAWREARLSVRPGVTGLWQVMRSREAGKDFQEWIQYDIEYVENVTWKRDLWIIFRTIFKSGGGGKGRG